MGIMIQFKLSNKELRFIYGILLREELRLKSFNINNEIQEQYRLDTLKKLQELQEKILYYLNKEYSLAKL